MFKKLISYYRRKRQIIDSFNKYSGYMHPGRYKFDDAMTYIYLANHSTTDQIKGMFKNSYLILSFNKTLLKSIILSLMGIVFYKDLHIKDNKNEQDFKGTAFVQGGAGKDFKIFDLINNKIILIHIDKEEYNFKIENYDHFSKFFKIPEILYKNDEELIIMEECIDFKINDKWSTKDHHIVIEDIFNSYIKYFKECKRKEEFNFKSISSLLSNKSKDSLIYSFANKYISKELLNTKWPFLKLHGDLWTSNVLIGKNDIYYIDWERSNGYIMLYDVLHIMWSDVLHISDYTYMKKYINGEYDMFLEEVFKIFNLKFDKDLKVDYLSITILNYIIDRFDGKEEESYKYIFDEYREVLGNIS